MVMMTIYSGYQNNVTQLHINTIYYTDKEMNYGFQNSIGCWIDFELYEVVVEVVVNCVFLKSDCTGKIHLYLYLLAKNVSDTQCLLSHSFI